MPRGGVCKGGVAAQSGAGTAHDAAGRPGEAGPEPGLMQPLPHGILPVPSETRILSLPVPAAAVHDGTVLSAPSWLHTGNAYHIVM